MREGRERVESFDARCLGYNRLPKIVAKGSDELSDSLNVVVLRANEAQRALPRVLAQTAHAEERFGDGGKVLGVPLAPIGIALCYIDVFVQVLGHESPPESFDICWFRLYSHLYLRLA